MSLTISEKILSAKARRRARAGDLVVCAVDHALGTDGSAPMALDYFAAMNGGRDGTRVKDAASLVFAFDHYTPEAGHVTARLQQRLREFAAAQGLEVWDVGEGIGHQLMVESGRARPGRLVVGADSHAVTYGALNCFATGIGSSDLAGILMSGKMWLRAPESIKVRLEGTLPPCVYPKDAVLAMARALGADGANYRALEFCGSALAGLDLEDRLVLSNMVVEMGAKNGVFPADGATWEYLKGRGFDGGAAEAGVAADAGAHYERELVIELDQLTPQVALPHQVEHVVPVQEAAGQPVQMVYLGTCTGGRVRDYHQALRVLESAGGVAAGVQLVVTPASRTVMETLARDGTLARFISQGATIGSPGCGSCCGTCAPIPADGINVISTANRNFKGRMGNAKASIYLASPATCAAAAARGAICDPREIMPGSGAR